MQLCSKCGVKLAKEQKLRINKGACTAWAGKCDACGENKSVTSSRHYGWPKLPEGK